MEINKLGRDLLSAEFVFYPFFASKSEYLRFLWFEILKNSLYNERVITKKGLMC